MIRADTVSSTGLAKNREWTHPSASLPAAANSPAGRCCKRVVSCMENVSSVMDADVSDFSVSSYRGSSYPAVFSVDSAMGCPMTTGVSVSEYVSGCSLSFFRKHIKIPADPAIAAMDKTSRLVRFLCCFIYLVSSTFRFFKGCLGY